MNQRKPVNWGQANEGPNRGDEARGGRAGRSAQRCHAAAPLEARRGLVGPSARRRRAAGAAERRVLGEGMRELKHDVVSLVCAVAHQIGLTVLVVGRMEHVGVVALQRYRTRRVGGRDGTSARRRRAVAQSCLLERTDGAQWAAGGWDGGLARPGRAPKPPTPSSSPSGV